MMNGAQQIVGGLLAYCFTLISSGPLKSWQWLFLSYAIISVIYGVFVGWWMPDSPMRAKCFSEEDKRLMIERVRDNQTGIQNRQFKKHQAIEALKDPQTWCYAGIQFCTTFPTSGYQGQLWLQYAADAVARHGAGFLHHLCPFGVRLPRQEVEPEHLCHAGIRCSVVYRHDPAHGESSQVVPWAMKISY
jgi:MFS family permease